MAKPDHNTDLHGNAPAASATALLLIDVLNDFLFEGGAALASETSAIVPSLLALKAAAVRHRVPVIYVNDNAGKWRSNCQAVIRKAMAAKSRGRTIARKLKPRAADYVVLKPKQSAFYGTPLELLLDYMKVRRLVIAGIAADICIRFTAQDAFVRDYDVWIPSDGVASAHSELTRSALEEMKLLFNATVRRVSEMEWGGWTKPGNVSRT